MVINISDKEISTKEIKTGEISSMPYGMIVWSTGIGTRRVIMDFMKQIGQVYSLYTSVHMIELYFANFVQIYAEYWCLDIIG